MTGYIDVGGGMRAVYGAGVLDRLFDDNISFSHYIGVSAGSANIISFVAGQRSRGLRFYDGYAFRREYMSFYNFIKNKSYIGLDYIYSTLTGDDGEDPLDFEAMMANDCEFDIVATNARSGEAEYFSFREMIKGDYSELKASCCIPIICPAYERKGIPYYDGGLSDPIPVKRLLDAGCDKIVIVLTRPIDFHKQHKVPKSAFEAFLKEYPETARLMDASIDIYNEQLEYAKQLEKEGRVLIIAPESCCGVNTLTRHHGGINALYAKGYEDARAVARFLEKD